jgi:hypothetical protein
MKKLMMVAAMLALTLVLAVPAFAAQSDGLGGLFGNGNNNGNSLGSLLGDGLGNLGSFLGLGNDNNGNGNNGNNHNGFDNNHNGFDNNHNGNGFNNGNGGVIQAPTETFVSGSNTNNAGSVTGGGDNSNTCAAQENFNNSGGVLNQPSLQQYASQSGGVLFGAPSFTNAPSQSAPCEPTVQQSASSSSQ